MFSLAWSTAIAFTRAMSPPFEAMYAASLGIDFEDAHLHDLADSDNRQWVFDEAVGKLGNMDKAILLDAYIYKGSKVYHIAHGTLQDHAGLQVLYF